MIYFLVTEYLPDYFSLDYTFMSTYIKEKKSIIVDEVFQNNPSTKTKISMSVVP
jgi:hypothetical protein